MRLSSTPCFARLFAIGLLAFAAGCSSVDTGPPPGSPGACPTDVTPRPGTVITDRGAVTGVAAGTTWAFKGIPYAAPPTGELRWRPPADAACWEGELDASAFGEACPQLDADGKYVGSEDCLTANVWTPQDLAEGEQLPVLFYIHGGGNTQGSAHEQANSGVLLYDGQSLVEHTRTVVVTIQYRLGAAAWFTHAGLAAESEHGVSGNYGTLDQIAALEWVQRNIAAFGGDPARVLVFGESAGAVNTCLMLTSPLARGLFSAALMESGACVAHTQETVETFGAELVNAAGCGADPDPIACMRALSSEALTLAIPSIVDVAGKQDDYQPHVDGYVIPDAPLALLSSGQHNHVPFLIGANAQETGAFVPQMSDTEYTQAVYALAGSQSLGDAILAEYPLTDYPTPRDAYVALTSDVKFICQARAAARAAAAGQTEPVYRYHFTHAIENAGPTAAALGAFHGLEVIFVFHHADQVPNYTATAGELALADAMSSYWARFGATGDPNGDGAVAWPRYDAAADSYLQLDNTIQADAGVRTEQCDFWDSLLGN